MFTAVTAVISAAAVSVLNTWWSYLLIKKAVKLVFGKSRGRGSSAESGKDDSEKSKAA
jgi:hypothetical protein